MARIVGDLHIHVGRTSTGQPVKITASRELTLENILSVAKEQKGLQLVGLVDAACQGVLADLEKLCQAGTLQPLVGGGYSWNGVTVFFGSEVEISHTTGKSAHFLAYFPDLDQLKAYAAALSEVVTNPTLSTQRLKIGADEWLQMALAHEGVALCAHAFTPHKGVYGSCVQSLGEMFARPELISGLELGLSANPEMALQITDTHSYAYIANSDAHSLANMAREFTIYNLSSLDFQAWKDALQDQGNGIASTHGLDPRLGKYFRSFCPRCQLLAQEEGPTLACPSCGSNMIYGVWDRLLEIKDSRTRTTQRPPNFAHVPLRMLPGVGPQTYKRMIETLGTEIEILYTLSLESIADLVGSDLAKQIAAVRSGRMPILPGGGGKYGRVTKV